jgi:hypothetical protein
MTASGIIRALSGVDNAVRRKAETLAARLSRRGVEARVERSGDGGYAVIASGEELLAREFGGVDRQPQGPIQEAVRDMKTGDSVE